MDYPLYMNVNQAAEYSGISADRIRELLHSAAPPPHIMSGRKYLIRRDGLADYLERLEVAR